MLSDEVRLFARAARVIEFEKLREICGDYQHLNYAKGTITLISSSNRGTNAIFRHGRAALTMC